MYFYNVGYDSHEDSEYQQFSHEQKFSKEEFFSVVRDCFLVALKAEKGPNLNAEYPTSFSDVLGRAAFPEAMKEKGFVPLKFTEQFRVFGWASAADPDSWEGHVSEEQQELAAWLRDKVLT